MHVPLTQVGDGTTTVVILAGELLRECKAFIEEGVHPRAIIRSFRQAGTMAVQHIQVGSLHATQKLVMSQKCSGDDFSSPHGAGVKDAALVPCCWLRMRP